MDTARPLSAAFLTTRGALAGAAPEPERQDLEAALAAAIVLGRAAWSAVDAGDERFAAFLGGRVGPSELETAKLDAESKGFRFEEIHDEQAETILLRIHT